MSQSGGALTLQLGVTLLPSYAGVHTIYIEASDSTTSTGWQVAGDLDVACYTTAGLGFNPLTPCRVVDTRVGQGKLGSFGPPRLSGYVSRDLPISSSPCAIPAAAQAFSLNMTVVPSGPLDFLSAWPAGLGYPGVSTLNSAGGTVLANAAIVPAGSQGGISVVSGQPTDLIVDANGYFANTPGSLVFYSIAPCRVSDTRAGQGRVGPFGPPALSAYANRDIPVRNVCGVPSNAQAYVVECHHDPAR